MSKAKYDISAIRYDPTPPEEGKPVFYVTSAKTEEDKAEAEIQKLEAFMARQTRMKALGIGTEQTSGKATGQKAELSPKRYLVDPETGKVDVAENGEGEYTYKDALLVSASIKGKKGQYDDAVSLINAAKTLSESAGAKASEEKLKEFWVDDTGIIHHDPENGEFTLSEARAVSQSKQRALVPRSENNITPEKLELMKRDIRDETTKLLTEQMKDLKRSLAPGEPEAAFSIGDKGDIELNPKAKLSLSDYLLYQVVKQNQINKQNPLLKDSEGNIMTLPQWLEVKKYQRDEDRKDKRNDAMVQALEEGRKELPRLVDGLRNISRSKEAEKAMEQGGWLGKGEMKTSLCPTCKAEVSYTSVPAIVTCPKCGALDFFGTPEQLKQIREQLGGGEPEKGGKPSSELTTSSEATGEATPKQS